MLKSASHIGSRIMRRACCTIRSNRVGMPSGLLFLLFGLGMYTLLTGVGSKVLALSASRRRVVYPSRSPRRFDLVIVSMPAVLLPVFLRVLWTASRSHTSLQSSP